MDTSAPALMVTLESNVRVGGFLQQLHSLDSRYLHTIVLSIDKNLMLNAYTYHIQICMLQMHMNYVGKVISCSQTILQSA